MTPNYWETIADEIKAGAGLSAGIVSWSERRLRRTVLSSRPMRTATTGGGSATGCRVRCFLGLCWLVAFPILRIKLERDSGRGVNVFVVTGVMMFPLKFKTD